MSAEAQNGVAFFLLGFSLSSLVHWTWLIHVTIRELNKNVAKKADVENLKRTVLSQL